LFNWSSFLQLLQAVWLPQTRTFADKQIKFLTGQTPYLLAKQLSKKNDAQLKNVTTTDGINTVHLVCFGAYKSTGYLNVHELKAKINSYSA